MRPRRKQHPKKKTFLCVSWEHTKKKFGQINQFPGQFDIRHKKKRKIRKYYQIYCDEMENSLLPDYISLSFSLSFLLSRKIDPKKHFILLLMLLLMKFTFLYVWVCRASLLSIYLCIYTQLRKKIRFLQ